MAKKKAAKKTTTSPAVKRPRGRPRKNPLPTATRVTTQTHTQYTPPPFQYQQPVPTNAPPYPLPSGPTSVDTTSTTTTSTVPIGGDLSDTMQTFNDAKSLYKSKNFWGAVSMFGLSLLTTLGTLPQIASNPVVMGCVGMAFAVLWIVFRFMTNQPVTPAITMPHPNEWFKKKN